MITNFKLFEGTYWYSPEKIEDDKINLFYIIYGNFNEIVKTIELLNGDNIHDILGNQLNSNIFEARNGLKEYLDSRGLRGYLNICLGCFLFYLPMDYGKPLKVRFFNCKSEKNIMMNSSKFRGVLKVENNKLIIDTLELDSIKYNL